MRYSTTTGAAAMTAASRADTRPDAIRHGRMPPTTPAKAQATTASRPTLDSAATRVAATPGSVGAMWASAATTPAGAMTPEVADSTSGVSAGPIPAAADSTSAVDPTPAAAETSGSSGLTEGLRQLAHVEVVPPGHDLVVHYLEHSADRELEGLAGLGAHDVSPFVENQPSVTDLAVHDEVDAVAGRQETLDERANRLATLHWFHRNIMVDSVFRHGLGDRGGVRCRPERAELRDKLIGRT